MDSISETLKQIEMTSSFDRLHPFRDVAVWSQCTEEERARLARLFVRFGEKQASQGVPHFRENFQIARELLQGNLLLAQSIAISQGFLLVRFPGNAALFEEGRRLFEGLAETDGVVPSLKGAVLYGRALSAFRLGQLSESMEELQKAVSYFEQASVGIESTPHHASVSSSEFYADWGGALFAIGQNSGEPCDLTRALEKYRMSIAQNGGAPTVLQNYAEALVMAHTLFFRPEFLREALSVYVRLMREFPETTLVYGQLLRVLSEMIDVGEVHADWMPLAEEVFCRGRVCASEEAFFWCASAQLDLAIARYTNDPAKIDASFEKIARSRKLDPEHEVAFLLSLEIEIAYGAAHESLTHLMHAKQVLSLYLKDHSDDLRAEMLMIECLNALGAYFEEEQFYYDALERSDVALKKFRHEQSRASCCFHEVRAVAAVKLGDLTGLTEYYEFAESLFSEMWRQGARCGTYWNHWASVLLKLWTATGQISYVIEVVTKVERWLRELHHHRLTQHLFNEITYHYGAALQMLGENYQDGELLERALKIFERLVDEEQLSPQVQHAIALTQFEMGEIHAELTPYIRALEAFQRLIQDQPDEGLFRLDYGAALTKFSTLLGDPHSQVRAQQLLREAEGQFLTAIMLGETHAFYELAGLYSLVGLYPQSIDYLRKARNGGVLPEKEDLYDDEWFVGLRATHEFQRFVEETF